MLIESLRSVRYSIVHLVQHGAQVPDVVSFPHISDRHATLVQNLTPASNHVSELVHGATTCHPASVPWRW